MNNTGALINDDSICFFYNDTMHHVTKGNLNFDAVKVAILEKRYEDAVTLLNPMKIIEKNTDGLLKAEGSAVYYKNDQIDDSLAKRLMDMISSGHTDLTHYLKFMENTYSNPSRASRTQLYNFIAHKEMPISDDGMVFGYKGVSADYMDIHSGTVRNMPGDVNEMERRDVDDNPNHGCSYGFHVGTKRYADSWAGPHGKLLIVKYDPADAVSVPEDGEFEKLRVRKYVVVCEVPESERDQSILTGHVYSDDDSGVRELEKQHHFTEEQEHGDNWYKARNYIETARDNGDTHINNRTLDDLFNISTWHASEWDSLVADTGIIPGQWTCALYPEEQEHTTSLSDLLDEATQD